jgi:hypothetical protein
MPAQKVRRKLWNNLWIFLCGVAAMIFVGQYGCTETGALPVSGQIARFLESPLSLVRPKPLEQFGPLTDDAWQVRSLQAGVSSEDGSICPRHKICNKTLYQRVRALFTVTRFRTSATGHLLDHPRSNTPPLRSHRQPL